MNVMDIVTQVNGAEDLTGFSFAVGMIVGLALAGMLFIMLKQAYMLRYKEYLFGLKTKDKETIESSFISIYAIVNDFATRTNTSFFKRMSNDLNELRLFLERKRP